MNDIINKICNPYLVLAHLCRHFPFRCISDKAYLKIFYRAYQNRKLDLDNPVTFNEKLQWLKLYDRKCIYTMLSDKYKVREYIKNTIGEEYLIPLLGMWKSPKEIDFEKLPEQFVLKCNHDSGSVIVCKDKSKLNIDKAFRTLNKGIKYQYYWKSREWNYKDIERCIIAEKYIDNQYNDELTDYKFFCFDGKPEFIQVDSGRFTDHIRNFYDTNWNYISVKYGCKTNSQNKDVMPQQYKKMLELATILSKGFPHVRVDFYVSGERIYFGEMTFHHGGGAMRVDPFEFDIEWGQMLHLPTVDN